jgi:hypothetical protein
MQKYSKSTAVPTHDTKAYERVNTAYIGIYLDTSWG